MKIKKTNEEALLEILFQSPLINQVFNLLDGYDDHVYYIGAGCIAQTVWNYKFGKSHDYGIKDIDFVYYNSIDISLEAENRVVENVRRRLRPVEKEIDCKNQARVHLWYESKFGVELSQYNSLEAAIATWPTTASAVGIGKKDDNYLICAPYGLDDLLSGVVRANKLLITEDVYISKSTKWKEKWGKLEVLPW